MDADVQNNWNLLVQSYAGPPAYYNHLTKEECLTIVGKLGILDTKSYGNDSYTLWVDENGDVTLFPPQGGLGTPQPQMKQKYKSAECYQ